MTGKPETAKPETSNPATGRPAGSHRDHKQPYATESENYGSDPVKAPTEPDQRRAGRGTQGGGDKTVEHPRRGGTSNEKGGT